MFCRIISNFRNNNRTINYLINNINFSSNKFPTSDLLEQSGKSFDQIKTNLASQMAYRTGNKFNFPKARRDESTTCTTFGVQVEDAYRYLEDADGEETKKFVEAQNALSDPFIKDCPYRQPIITRLKSLFEYPRYSCPFKKGNNYFMQINSGLQNQYVYYIMRGSLDAKPEVFLDPNTLSSDGTVSLSSYANEFSKDGKWYAYGLNMSGSDWISIKIKNVDTGNDLPEEITKLKFSSISWTHDNQGFFYAAYSSMGDGTETTECTFEKLYYHRIGTPQSKDVMVYERPDDPHYRFTTSISHCGRYLHVYSNKTCEYNLFHYYRFDDPLNPNITGILKLEPVVEELNADYYYVTNDGPIHYVRTNYKAPNYRLTVIDLTDSNTRQVDNWKDLINEHPKDVLQGCYAAREDLLITKFIRDVTHRIEIHRLSDGSLIRELNLPVGAIVGLSAERNQDELFYGLTSFLIPGVIFYLKLDQDLKNEPVVFKESKPANFDHTNFVTKQIFYPSKDGTNIPMFLVHHKDFVQDGQNPCMLYSYGGFNISVMPSFSLQRIILMENLGGVFALANIRGGGEYGERWHNGGKLENKQTCFDDFISAGEYLVRERYTSSNKLIIQGGSNGGLLVGAVTNQRPDLFGASIAHVGVMDLLRFHKFTIGHAWMSEYGNPEVEKDFRNLIRLSPLHNVPDPNSIDRFPAILLLTGDHDDRVVPLHSLKLIAQLQYKLGDKFGETPIMARIDTKSGHGAGKPTEKIIEEVADIYGFIINALSLNFKQST